MRISPISFTTFTGKEVPYITKLGENGLKSLPDFYPASSVEKTLGSHHSFEKNKVYFASPMEFVPDSIKEKVDFVVYDNEPSYPKLSEIEKNYLAENRTDYRKQFENIREYYYRREMGGCANSNEAKYQQWQAAKCTGLYDKAGDLRYKKECAEDEIKALNAEKESITNGIKTSDFELKNQLKLKQDLNQHIKALDAMQNACNRMQTIYGLNVQNEGTLYAEAAERMKQRRGKAASGNTDIKYNIYENTSATYNSINKAKKKVYSFIAEENNIFASERLQTAIDSFKNILEENERTIKEIGAYINELRSKIKAADSRIAEKQTFIEDCKSKLKPLFDELAGFYKQQGIKIIKK